MFPNKLASDSYSAKIKVYEYGFIHILYRVFDHLIDAGFQCQIPPFEKALNLFMLYSINKIKSKIIGYICRFKWAHGYEIL